MAEERRKKLLGTETKSSAFEQLLDRYRSLLNVAALAGYTEEDVKAWHPQGEVKKSAPLKKELSRQNRRIFFFSFFASLAVSYLFMSIWQHQLIMLAIPCILICLPLLRSYLRCEQKSTCKYYDTEAFLMLRALSDQYLKRHFNSIFLAFGMTSLNFLTQLAL